MNIGVKVLSRNIANKNHYLIEQIIYQVVFIPGMQD